MMKKILLPVVVSVSACAAEPPPFQKVQLLPEDRQVVQMSFDDNLGDSGSVQTRDVQAYQYRNGIRVVCGQVNSLDGFGVYTGFQIFRMEVIEDSFQTSFIIGPSAARECSTVGYRPVMLSAEETGASDM